MEQKLWDLKAVETKEQAQFTAQLFMGTVYDEKVYQKEVGKQFLEDLSDNIKSKTSSTASKYFCLEILHHLITALQVKVISQLSGHPLFAEIQEIAFTDPRKPASEKGKKMFPNDDVNKYGNLMVRLCLQTLIFLGKKFPYKNGSKEPTKFKKVLNNLTQQNIVLPEEFLYYVLPSQKKLSKDATPSVSQKQTKQKKFNAESLIAYTSFKIQEYMGNLEDCDSVDQLQEEILKKHDILSKQLQKYEEYSEKIFEEPEQIIETYLNIQVFLQKENEFFNNYVPNLEADKYFEELKKQYEMNLLKPTPSSQYPQEQMKPSIEMKQSSSLTGKSSENQKSKMLQSSQKRRKASNLMENIFNKLENRKKSPENGFKLVKESLEKEKKLIQAHPPRSKQNKRRELIQKTGASNFAKSLVKAPSIFNQPPNPIPPFKNFDGEEVRENRQLQSILYDIKKDQGMRRFKLANLKEKYPIFENDSLQIGFKIETVYEELDAFPQAIYIQLFFGNKTSRPLRQFELFYEGDNTNLIYQNPQDFPYLIDPQSQIKHQVIIVPKKVPFAFINMKFSYESSQSSIRSSAALPCSFLRLTEMQEIQRGEFEDFWRNTSVIYRTKQFKLSRHISPNCVKKYLNKLSEMTSYSDFEVSGSTTDYELFCQLEIKKSQWYGFKLTIRPDLQVVLQIGSLDVTEEQLNHMRFYLQTLQMILQECG